MVYRVLVLLFFTIVQNSNCSLLNIINVEYSESEYKATDKGKGINAVTIIVTYTTTDPSKIQTTWMKELPDGTLPIYVGDREFITRQDTFSIGENVTEVHCYIEYLVSKNEGGGVGDELDIPDFQTTLKQINFWIHIESNTIVKLLNLDTQSKWRTSSSYFSLTKSQNGTMLLNSHDTILRTGVEFTVDPNTLNGNDGKGSWFYTTKNSMFRRFAKIPPRDAMQLKDGANGTSLQYTSKDSKVQNRLVQEQNKDLTGLYIFLLSTENIVLQSSVVVNKEDKRYHRIDDIKVTPFFVCSMDRLDIDSNAYGKMFGIAYPKSVKTSCIRFLLTHSVEYQKFDFDFRNQNGISPHPTQYYRTPSGIANSDFIYLFADDEFEMGDYALDIAIYSPHGQVLNEMFTFKMINYTTATVTITKVELTRAYTKVECLATGNPKPDYINMYVDGMDGECQSRYTNCEITEGPGGTLLQWKIPLREQQLQGRVFVCEARPKYQGYIQDTYLIEK